MRVQVQKSSFCLHGVLRPNQNDLMDVYKLALGADKSPKSPKYTCCNDY